MPESAYLLSALLLLGFPLLAFIFLWVGGRGFNKAAGWIGATVTGLGLLICLVYFDPTNVHTINFEWIRLGTFTVDLPLRFDGLTWLMLLLVHFVALLVQIYSTSYLSHDPSLYRYFAFIQLFLFSMIGILLSGGLLVMYIFWELVGLSSYLLIGFWYKKPRAVWAAQKAFILNRIGDAAFLAGILLLIANVDSTNFNDLPVLIQSLSPSLLTTIGICLFGGCVGKSAQFPLSAWLPDAMEGPTPVSALIHAATMVAAGIFLMARIAFLLTPDAQLVIATIGTITMGYGALKATRVWDIKRVLAYSTMSQLGLMVLAVGLGNWQLAIFHLTTHAFFKAGLFLSAGSVIHALAPSDGLSKFDPQDMRNMGGLRKVMPITFACYLICSAALAGLPFFSGFLSKDAIFLHAFSLADEKGFVAYLIPLMAMAAAGLTAYYMTRQVWLVFMGKPRYSIAEVHPHESSFVMWLPMVILSGLSVFVWFSFNPVHASSGWFLSWLGVLSEHHSSTIPVISVIITALSITAAYKQANSEKGFSSLPHFLGKVTLQRVKRGINLQSRLLAEHSEERAVKEFFLIPVLQVANFFQYLEVRIVNSFVDRFAKFTVVLSHVINWFDKNVIDGGVRLTAFLIRLTGRAGRRIQNGKIQSYFLVTTLSLVALLLWWLII